MSHNHKKNNESKVVHNNYYFYRFVNKNFPVEISNIENLYITKRINNILKSINTEESFKQKIENKFKETSN